jgi:hypothetical protein
MCPKSQRGKAENLVKAVDPVDVVDLMDQSSEVTTSISVGNVFANQQRNLVLKNIRSTNVK